MDDWNDIERTADEIVQQWPAGISGSKLFDSVYGFLGRFIAYPSENARVAHVLWLAHIHPWWSHR